VVVFGQGGLEIGCGDMVWASLISTPLHEEAIAQAQHHCENQHSVVVAHPAAVVVVGDIQALMPISASRIWIAHTRSQELKEGLRGFGSWGRF
jgi:hypothetical protein